MGILINTKSVEAVYRGNDEVSAIYVGSNKVWPETKEYILFLDSEVERICIAEYSSDGIGCTVLDLNSATTLYDFSGNTVILYFPEFKYFTSITNAQLAGKFKNCTNLKSIEIPNLITELSRGLYYNTGLFYNCTSLTDVTLPSSLVAIKSLCFENCTSLKTISLPNTLTIIESNAFKNSGILNIQLPSSLITLEYSCFYITSLLSITIPNSVTNIGYSAFRKITTLTTVTFEQGGTAPLTLYGTSAWSGGLFTECPNLAEVRFPSRLSIINNGVLSIAYNGSNKSIRYVFEGTTPPTVNGTLFSGGIQQATMYVPDEALEDYKAATGFSTYASSIFPISQLPTT